MLLVFATTVAGGMGILNFLSRDLLLSSFQDLETDPMKHNVLWRRPRARRRL